MPDLEDYLNLPYTVVLRRDEQGEHVARIDELAGLSAHGRTPQEALEISLRQSRLQGQLHHP